MNGLIDAPSVWGLCRRLLRDEQDAEDAFQATFLVLARKAGSVAWREDARNWLYAVALRIAKKARARRRRLPGNALDVAALQAPETVSDHETAAVVAEEIGRLPDRYRRPMILCGLEGKSYAEAARELGWPEGTVSGRLPRARELLRQRLSRRGLGPAIALPLPLAPPAGVALTTPKMAVTFAAGLALDSSAAALAREALRSMLMSKLRLAAGAVFVLMAVTVGMAFLLPSREVPAAPAPLPRRDREPDEAAMWASPKIRPLGRMGEFHKVGAISPDGRELVITGDHADGAEALVYDLTRGKVVREVQTEDTIHGSAVSPDGKLLALAEWRDGVSLRDYRTLKALRTIRGSGGLGSVDI